MNKFLFSFLIVNLMFVFSAQAQEQTSASKTKKRWRRKSSQCMATVACVNEP